ncbi:MAG: D-aminoacylase [Thermovirga sp.]|nr:D-aminoacylase [Thermovirga sp.]
MFDLLVRDARLYDGCGGPWYKGDLAVKDGKIAKIGKIRNADAPIVINAEGKALSPGFIDAHTHLDFVCSSINDTASKVTQGVTTEIAGNCGLSLIPVRPETIEELKQYLAPFIPSDVNLSWKWRSLENWFDRVDEKGNSTNVASLVGHGTLRIYAMGFDDRKPSGQEMTEMKKALAQSMEEGALGLSTGLIYPPGCYSDTDELSELCEVVAEYGGLYVTHMRNEGPEMLQSVEEALEIGRRSGCPVHISHHKSSGRQNFGLVSQSLRMLEDARTEGIDVTCDVYPYTAGSTLISSLLPKWVHEGGVRRMLERLKDLASRQRIVDELNRVIPGWENLVKGCGWDNIMISSCENEPTLEGKTITEIASERRSSPEDTLLDMILETEGKATIALFMMDEKDCSTVLVHPLSMVGSDGFASSFTGVLSKGKPHPRSFGTFPRVLGKYVREDDLMTLERALWKMTGFPAQRFGLKDRGFLKEGMAADLVVFDPLVIIDNATYKEPRQQADGIDYVILGGEIVVDHKEYNGKTPGKSLR